MLLVIFCFALFGCLFAIPDDCFIVKSTPHDKCYHVRRGWKGYYSTAKEYCRNDGGELALVNDDNTWKLIIDNVLTQGVLFGDPLYVWVRPWIPAGGLSLQDAAGLPDTSFWSKSRITNSTNNKCIAAAQPKNFQWEFFDCYTNFLGLCEYIVANCNIADITIPNAQFQSCYPGGFVGINESVTIECWSGFHLEDVNNSNATCKNGVWQKPFPKCIPGCKIPSEARNSALLTIKPFYNVRERVSYVCNDGYFNWQDSTKTHFIRDCQSGGTWSNERSYCSKSNFTTVVIDIGSVRDQTLTLNCSLTTSNITWFKDDVKIVIENGRNGMKDNFLLGQMKLSEITNGTYYCFGYINGVPHIGKIFYKFVNDDKCKAVGKIQRETREEGQSILLQCSQQRIRSLEVKWYKDHEPVLPAQNILPNAGLFLTNLLPQDQGTYTCESNHNDDKHYCKRNRTYVLTINEVEKFTCGVSSETKGYKHPWLVTLQDEDEDVPFCYGSILNKHWAITSAFCLSSLRRKKKIRGIYVELSPHASDQLYPVESVHVHSEYNTQLYSNNIGLVKLQVPIKFEKNVLPVCIEKIEFLKNYECDATILEVNGTVSGWGSLLVDNAKDMVLRNENQSVVSITECRKFIGYSKDIFCVTNLSRSERYAGDRGSPFVTQYGGRRYLVGIFNWGERLTQLGKLDYFTNIFYHYEWIKNITGI